MPFSILFQGQDFTMSDRSSDLSDPPHPPPPPPSSTSPPLPPTIRSPPTATHPPPSSDSSAPPSSSPIEAAKTGDEDGVRKLLQRLLKEDTMEKKENLKRVRDAFKKKNMTNVISGLSPPPNMTKNTMYFF